jgi:Uma2 family endonuclease
MDLFRAKGTLRISEHHAREPDLMIIALFDDVRAVRPSDVLLIAETCVSSTTRDLKEKRQAYANAAIQEYWVCEVEKCALHIFRRPEDGDYAEHQILRSGEHVSPLFAPQIVFAVEALVPKET